MKQLYIKALIDNNEEMLRHFSKIIAHSVRDEIEQFHVDYLTDEQMKELNPLIRKGIYNILFSVANCDSSKFCADYIKWHSIAIPPYWEEPELDTHLQKEIKQKDKRTICFKAVFLNEQFKLGNIIYKSISGSIEIIPSFEFKEVPGDKHKHRNKISAQLRKEGFQYSPGLYGYILIPD